MRPSVLRRLDGAADGLHRHARQRDRLPRQVVDRRDEARHDLLQMENAVERRGAEQRRHHVLQRGVAVGDGGQRRRLLHGRCCCRLDRIARCRRGRRRVARRRRGRLHLGCRRGDGCVKAAPHEESRKRDGGEHEERPDDASARFAMRVDRPLEIRVPLKCFDAFHADLRGERDDASPCLTKPDGIGLKLARIGSREQAPPACGTCDARRRPSARASPPGCSVRRPSTAACADRSVGHSARLRLARLAHSSRSPCSRVA